MAISKARKIELLVNAETQWRSAIVYLNADIQVDEQIHYGVVASLIEKAIESVKQTGFGPEMFVYWRSMVGFRNLVSQEYDKIQPEKVVSILQNSTNDFLYTVNNKVQDLRSR